MPTREHTASGAPLRRITSIRSATAAVPPDPERTDPERIDLLGVPLHRLDRATARVAIAHLAARPGHDVVAFLNAHCSNLAAADPAYRAALLGSALVLNDGVGVALAARLQGVPVRDDLNGTDLLPSVLADLTLAGRSVFFYGAAPGVAARTAAHWSRRLPGLRVAGALDGYTLSGAAAAEVIRGSGADVVLVALGVPRQELWAARYGHRTGAALTVGVGAFFDFSVGVVRRAPRPVRRLRLEWAFRLAQEPRRLARRYLLGNPAFLFRVALAQVRTVQTVRPVPPAASDTDRQRHPSAARSRLVRPTALDPGSDAPTRPVERAG